ncbi:MAG: uracil-DNA glycosylase [Alphaproteobacteria bacterium]
MTGVGEHGVALLEWYALAGADEAVGEAPLNWYDATVFNQAKALPGGHPAGKAANPAPLATPAVPKAEAQDPALLARSKAAEAGDLRELEEILRNFDGCALKQTAKNTCFADGNPQSDIMFIGEAPGRDEDLDGRPFVGRAGKLLDAMLGAINLDRSRVYITNIIYWRPPGNRTPSPAEAAICRPFIERQIALIDPKIVVFLGGAAAKNLLDTTQGIMRLRGKWRTYKAGETEIRAMPTLHPAYLLRQPGHKRLAWQDLLAIRAALDETHG